MYKHIIGMVTGLCMTYVLPTFGQAFNLQNPFCAYQKNNVISEEHSLTPELDNAIKLKQIQDLLTQSALSQAVVHKVLTTLKCANKHEIKHNHILTVVDYSLPSGQKRLWIFDLKKNQLLYHTYVSHGIRSGIAKSFYFSNQHNSKTSSIGVYKTDKSYYGRHGTSLKLAGLERGFNDNAFNRAIVMHGGWYVKEEFIKKYGRAGRSWGCPAVPSELTKPIINTIKDNALFVAYYPNEHWFIQSKFLTCDKYSPIPKVHALTKNEQKPEENRDDILFAEKNNNNTREENEPIIAISAENYQRYFHARAPLKRMLRRQINDEEYIALNDDEFAYLSQADSQTENSLTQDRLKEVSFIIPVVKKVRGYYATEMKILPYGEIKEIAAKENADQQKEFTVYFSNNKTPLHVKSTSQFIRWLGL